MRPKQGNRGPEHSKARLESAEGLSQEEINAQHEQFIATFDSTFGPKAFRSRLEAGVQREEQVDASKSWLDAAEGRFTSVHQENINAMHRIKELMEAKSKLRGVKGLETAKRIRSVALEIQSRVDASLEAERLKEQIFSKESPLFTSIEGQVQIAGIDVDRKHKSAIESRRFVETPKRAREIFENYAEALASKYMTPSTRSTGIADEFMTKVYQNRISNRLDDIFQRMNYSMKPMERKELTEKAFHALASEIENDFKQIAAFSGDPKTIETSELKKLKEHYQASIKDTPLEIIHSRNVSAVVQRLENAVKVSAKAQKEWQKLSAQAAKDMIALAEQNGTEALFAVVVLGEGNEKKFAEAKKRFTETMKARAKAGPHQTFQYLKGIDAAVNTPTAAVRENYDGRFGRLVAMERNQLLNGRTLPRNNLDKTLVMFMRARDRKEFLQSSGNKTKLLRAIKKAKEFYVEEQFKSKYTRAMEQFNESAKYMASGNPSKPNTANEAARLAVLIDFANEAEVLAMQFGGEKTIKQQLEDIQLNEEAKYIVDLEFQDTHKAYPIRMLSRAQRGGFNGTDMLWKLAEGASYTVATVNALDALKQGDITAVASNPWFLATAGTAYVSRERRLTQGFTSIPFESKAVGDATMVRSGLNGLTRAKDAGGRVALKRYLDGTSFEVWEELSAKSEEVKEVISQKIREAREPKYDKNDKKLPNRTPVLTHEDLAKIIEDPTIAAKEKPGNDRMRFLFLQKFFRKARDIDQFSQAVDTWT